MALFKPYAAKSDKDAPAATSAKATPSPAPTVGAPAAPATHGKKSIPTPTRRQAEDARRSRIQPVVTKKESRAKERDAKYKAQDQAMAKIHARPYNVLIQHWIDRRWNLLDFAMPVMLLLMVIVIAGQYFFPSTMTYGILIVYALVLAVLIDVAIMWVGLRVQLKQHFPNEPLKGKLRYAIARVMQMRRSRVPGPQVKRGSRWVWPPEGQ